MKRSVITKLGVGILTAALLCGCQTLGRGPSDKELVNTTMADWKAALTARDMDKLMAAYSENYASERGTDKNSVREFMTRVFDEDWMDNIKVNMEDAETTIEGDKAEFGPVEFISDRGTMKIDYTLQKEDGAWRIVGSKRQEQ